ncbi:Putative mitochondrial ATPase inhibitor [Septoria linicola]|uniref:ATPase inhibitor, mitochondrial n=1 Tax=Septoria linicola TaxID=215465 RepID=A0A9Q9EP55_9PEZI|nr:Putative mitochondrial ATPase inhibitor [Septoria linicola]
MTLPRITSRSPMVSLNSFTNLTSARTCTRTFSTSAPVHNADGDTGGTRSGGEAAGDSWTRREKAAENVYIRAKEKSILLLLKEKIAAQEAILAKDKAILAAMEDQYGREVEGRDR